MTILRTILLLCLLCASARAATPTLLGQASATNGSLTTSTLDTHKASLLVCVIGNYVSITPPTDNLGNTWIPLPQISFGGMYHQVFYVTNPLVSTSQFVTISGGYPCAEFLAFSGTDGNAFDSTNYNAGAVGTTVQVGSITPSQVGELMVAVMVNSVSTAGTTIDSGYSIIDNISSIYAIDSLSLAYNLSPSLSPLNPTFTTLSSGYLDASHISFKYGNGTNRLVPQRGPMTTNCANGNFSTVQSVINGTIDGDTVIVPPSTNIWNQCLYINTDITLSGTNVIIYDGNTNRSGDLLISWNSHDSTNLSRLTGFTFAGLLTNSVSNLSVDLDFYGTNNAVIVDHCNLISLYGFLGLKWTGAISGVMSHDYFEFSDDDYLGLYPGALGGFGAGNNSGWGDEAWANPVQWGSTNQFLYIEDCIAYYHTNINNSAWFLTDVGAGGKIVARYNTLTNCMFYTHGTDSGGRTRGMRAFEEYNNTFIIPATPVEWQSLYMRSGDAVCFSNTLIGGFQNIAGMVSLREHQIFSYGGANGYCPLDSNSPTIYYSGTMTKSNALDLPIYSIGYSNIVVSAGVTNSYLFVVVNTNSIGSNSNLYNAWKNSMPSYYQIAGITGSKSYANGLWSAVNNAGSYTTNTGTNFTTLAYVNSTSYAAGTNLNHIDDSPSAPTGGTFSYGWTILTDTNGSFTPGQWYGAGYTVVNLDQDGTNYLDTSSRQLFGDIITNDSSTITIQYAPNWGPLQFFSGNHYQILKVIRAFDQPGAGSGALITDTYYGSGIPIITNGLQSSEPSYGWSNTINGSLAPLVSGPSGSILPNRDYFDNTRKPGYTPLVYPHPLVFSPSIPPVINVQPIGQTNLINVPITFSVIASGEAPITYQWYIGGIAPGLTNSSFTASFSTAFSYAPVWVIVANSYGSAVSGTAVLSVTNAPPTNTIYMLPPGLLKYETH